MTDPYSNLLQQNAESTKSHPTFMENRHCQAAPKKPRRSAICELVLSILFAAFGLNRTALAANVPTLRILSSGPAFVTGGDALVEVASQAGAKISLAANGQDATAILSPGAIPGTMVGLVRGLKLGANTLTASSAGVGASLAVTNYPRSGPVFSGPHQAPFICETETFALPGGATLGKAANTDCEAPTNVMYLYKPVGSDALKVYDPAKGRPNDIAPATMRDGQMVDYSVRLETGVINRAIYQIAFLHKPGTPLPKPGVRTPGWNGALVYTFGGGCGAAYRQGRGTGGVINGGETGIVTLELGFAVASSTLNVLGGNCNDVTSAETAMMVKEHFIEEFGPPTHTIGSGGSGGSMQQHLLSQNYPGILDGIIPGRSFPDTATTLPAAADCPLLMNYFKNAGLAWTDDQKRDVSGFATFNMCIQSWSNYLPRWVSPLWSGCDAMNAITEQEAAGAAGGRSGAIPRSLLYDPKTNPSGARCGYYDNAVNIYGRRPDGVTQRALDNAGVQYGLGALKAGSITVDQFIDLNEKIGGYNDDGDFVSARTVADTAALTAAYTTGRVNQARGLNTLPILDIRAYLDFANPSDVHTKYTSSVTRARLIAAYGKADNQVIWTVASTPRGTPRDAVPLNQLMRVALVSMDRWLEAIDRDASNIPRPQKVVKNKPSNLNDACFTESLERIDEPDTYDGKGRCNALFPNHADPRIVAGSPLSRVVLKCALKAVDPTDYPASLTPNQLARIKAAFPKGVCDFRKPGVGQAPLAGTWLKFTTGPVVGGNRNAAATAGD